MRYFFTSDQHLGHKNILGFQGRPFTTIEEHDAELIKRHNEVVKKDDVVIHAGDFAWKGNAKYVKKTYIDKLNGNNVFIRGSHDGWMAKAYPQIWEKNINGQYIVVCHYAMRVWPRSHYDSWHLYGHSHGKLPDYGYSMDIGVDNWDFYPVSWEQIVEVMLNKNEEPERCEKCGEAILGRGKRSAEIVDE